MRVGAGTCRKVSYQEGRPASDEAVVVPGSLWRDTSSLHGNCRAVCTGPQAPGCQLCSVGANGCGTFAL